MPNTRKNRENIPASIIFPHQKHDPMDFISLKRLAFNWTRKPFKIYLYIFISVQDPLSRIFGPGRTSRHKFQVLICLIRQRGTFARQKRIVLE